MYLIVNPVVKTHTTTECWIILYALWQLELQSINQGFATDHIVFSQLVEIIFWWISFSYFIISTKSNENSVKKFRVVVFHTMECINFAFPHHDLDQYLFDARILFVFLKEKNIGPLVLSQLDEIIFEW